VIPRANVTAWRKRAPWPDDALVEQDLVLSRALVEVFSHPAVAAGLAFRGGTALHKLILASPARYSEDIDLVQLDSGPIGHTLRAIQSKLDPWLGSPRTRQARAAVRLLYGFQSELAPTGSRRLKIEINTREHFSVLGLTRPTFQVENPWFQGAAQIPTYALEELLATKLRALYQRKKGRDLFDLSLALRQLSPDLDQVVHCFLRYVEHGRTPVSRAQFEANLAGKCEDPAFIGDTRPLLVTGATWDPEAALRLVADQLVARIPGAPWRGRTATDG
jgi:predicted nucleotidyltransferase component of viral defense system